MPISRRAALRLTGGLVVDCLSSGLANPRHIHRPNAMKHLITVAISLFLAAPAYAQTVAELKSELRKMENASADDADGLFTAAVWARERGLDSDYQRILDKVLKVNSRHEDANLALGNVEYMGFWMSRPEMFKSMGLVEEDGVWIEKDQRKDADEGIFHHMDELVSRDELAAFQAGKVRHPVTGEFIDERDLAKTAGASPLFPLGEGEWGTREEADQYHSTMDHPWIVRSAHTTMVATMPLVDIQNGQGWVDAGYGLVYQLFNVAPNPANRPIVCFSGSSEQHIEFGDAFGGSDSAHGAFIAEGVMEVAGIPGVVQPVFVNYGEEAWRAYHIRHGAGLAYIEAIRRQNDAIMPEWFMRGLGAYAGRHALLSLSGWFGETDVQVSGGVKDGLRSWFQQYTLGGMNRNGIDHNIYQAGLMVRFALAPEDEGGDSRVSDNWQDVVEVIQEGDSRGTARTIDRLEKSYYSKQEEIRSYLQWLIREKEGINKDR